MAEITASLVKELRDKTNAGMMDCKAALKETNGDMEAAIDWLRLKGISRGGNKGDRDAKEGVIHALISDDTKVGVLLEVCCETDFVAKNEDFVAFANQLTDLALANKCADADALKALSMDGATVGDKIIEQVGKIGEKIDVVNYVFLQGENIVPYIHAGNLRFLNP